MPRFPSPGSVEAGAKEAWLALMLLADPATNRMDAHRRVPMPRRKTDPVATGAYNWS
jgi:hypothetical protein